MEQRQLGGPEIVAVVSLVVFFVATWLPWFGVNVGNRSPGSFAELDLGTANGWDTGLLWSFVPLLLGAGLVALLVLPALSPSVERADLAPVLPLVLGGSAAGLVVVKLLVGTGVRGAEAAAAFGIDLEVNREIGLFVAVLAALGMLAAGALAFRRDAAGPPGPGATPPPPR